MRTHGAALALLAVMASCAGRAERPVAVADIPPCRADGKPAAAPGCPGFCRAAELPVDIAHGVPLATMRLNDLSVTMLIDTGASTSNLSAEAAATLGLGVPKRVPGTVVGVGGAQPRRVVPVGKLAFGTVELRGLSWPVLAQARPRGVLPPDGAIGQDILSRFEVDLDLPRGRVALYRGAPCAGRLPGWPAERSTLPFDTAAPGRHVLVAAALEGKPVLAMIDSGAAMTLVGTPTALAAGVKTSELAADRGGRLLGIGANIVLGRLHRFRRLEVGGERLVDVEAAVAALPFARPEMVLGADFLRTHRVWVSFAAGRVYVAGGAER